MLEHALRIADRSPLHRYRTGALLVDRSGKILSTGWAHMNEHRYTRVITCHAEMHALRRAGRSARGATLFVAAVNRNDAIVSARPCEVCAQALLDAGVRDVVYSTPDGAREEQLDPDGAYHKCRRPGEWAAERERQRGLSLAS